VIVQVLTERDKKIIVLINRFGYLTATQVARAMRMSQRVAYRRLQKLTERRYLTHRRILAGQPGIYTVTATGREEINAELGRFTVRLQTLPHNLVVADVALVLLERYPGLVWVTERELRREAGQRFGFGQNIHVPDGVLILPNGKRIAVEVEVTAKEKRRVEKIMRGYLRNADYAEVWYFCRTPRQVERVKEVAKGYDFVKAFALKDVLTAEGAEKAQEAF